MAEIKSATGISLPTRVENGRWKLKSGDPYVEQLIGTSFGSGDSDNPFQDIGLGEFMIFEVNADAVEGEIKRRAQAGFRSLERDQLARLSRGSRPLRFTQDGAVKRMFVEYENLENGERREAEVPLPPSGE
jgi:hypothetical protein